MSLYEAMTQSQRRKGSYGRFLEKLRGSLSSAHRGEPAAAHRDEPASTQRGERPQKTEPAKPVPAEPKQEPDTTLRSSEAPSLRITRTEKAGSSGIAQAKPEAQAKSDVAAPKVTTRWLRRPRALQFNIGRVEFSMSYPVAIAIVMGLVLLFLLVFRVGQYYSLMSKQPSGHGVPAEPGPAASLVNPPSSVVVREASPAETKVESVGTPPAAAAGGPAAIKAGNVIVIVEYSKRADLVPVQKYFSQSGIETEIISLSGKYFLITKDRFEGFGAGSDGYQAKQKIVEVGAKYKAPQGYETFAPLFFKDAYGRKVE